MVTGMTEKLTEMIETLTGITEIMIERTERTEKTEIMSEMSKLIETTFDRTKITVGTTEQLIELTRTTDYD